MNVGVSLNDPSGFGITYVVLNFSCCVYVYCVLNSNVALSIVSLILKLILFIVWELPNSPVEDPNPGILIV